MRHSLIYNYLREPGVSMSQNAYKHQCSKHLITVDKGTIFYRNSHKKIYKKFGTTPILTKGLGDSEIIRTFASLEPAKPLNDAQMCGSFYNSSVMTDEFLFLSYNTTLSGHLIGHLLGHS